MRNHAQLHVVRVAVAAVLAAVFFGALAVPALGADSGGMTLQWGTSGRGGMSNGTHGWVVANAARLAARHGAKWVDVSRAVARSSWPDTVFWDQIDHNYNWWGSHTSYYSPRWGNRFGHPQNKIGYFYARTGPTASMARARGTTTPTSASRCTRRRALWRTTRYTPATKPPWTAD